jgi:hypothetical protein
MLHGRGSNFYAIGIKKILLMPEIQFILEQIRKKAMEKKGLSSTHIKEASLLFYARGVARMKKLKILYLQRFWKKRGEMIQQKRAMDFYKQTKLAIEKFKTEKRKESENKTAIILRDVFSKKGFGDQVEKGIKAREKVKKSLYNYLIFWRFRKLLIVNFSIKSLVNKSWHLYRERIERRSAVAT